MSSQVIGSLIGAGIIYNEPSQIVFFCSMSVVAALASISLAFIRQPLILETDEREEKPRAMQIYQLSHVQDYLTQGDESYYTRDSIYREGGVGGGSFQARLTLTQSEANRASLSKHQYQNNHNSLKRSHQSYHHSRSGMLADQLDQREGLLEPVPEVEDAIQEE